MLIEFATCNRRTALEFLQQALPLLKLTDTPESIGALLNLVERGIVRIQDPSMYGFRIGIILGANWNESFREEVLEAGKILLASAE